jgi:hypothetical protein
MNLAEILLAKLADWRPARRQSIHVSTDGSAWALVLSADRCDELGCLVWELGLRRVGPTPAGESLKNWAERVAADITGLLEPLKVVEVDEGRREAMLRSEDAAQRGEELFYYELLLKDTREALLRRYHAYWNGSGRREQISFALTHDALAKLIRDLSGER